MFKKLKEKIEEVKSSPQRLQFTQSTGNNTSVPEENLFSIADEEPNADQQGFTSVSLSVDGENKMMRRNSNSSVASDVSFLPRYEAPQNFYHLQSDLDVSASEQEDNASTSSQLGHLSKEQIYAAFQKSQIRYHKYRGRYSDLIKHYRELERENGKMKSVLVETQDKAIRRVAELKEQCSLEQKAKAHLENALRVELDEKQYKIDTLQTQIGLLSQNKPSTNETNDTTQLETLTKDLHDAREEIENLNAKIQEMKANSIVFQSKESDYKAKIGNLEKEINLASEREKETNLKFAQNKMELHNEIIAKDNEISHLKIEVEKFKDSKYENLQIQNKKLIEKLENLTQKCNGYERELLKLEQREIEVKNLNEQLEKWKKQVEFNDEKEKQKQSEFENKLEKQREDAKMALLSLEKKIKEKLKAEYEQREEEMKQEFLEKILSVNENDNLQEKLLQVETCLKTASQEKFKLQEMLQQLEEKYNDIENNHLELITESSQQRNELATLKNEISDLQTSQNLLQEQKEALEKEKAIWLLEKTNLEAKIESLQVSLEKEKQVSENLAKQHEIYKNQIEGELSKNESFTEQLKNSDKKLRQSEEKCLKQNELLEKLENQLSDEKERNGVLEKEINKQKKAKEEVLQNISKLETENKILEDVYSKQIASLEVSLKETSAECKKCEIEKQKLEKLMHESETLKKELEANQDENKKCLEKIANQENQLDTLAKQKNNLENTLNKYGDLQLENDELKSKIILLEEEIKKKNTEFKNILTQKEFECSTNKSKLKTAEEEKQQLANEFLNLEHKLVEKNKITEDDHNRIKMENKNLSSHIASLKAELEEIIKRNETLKERLQENESRSEVMETSHETIKKEKQRLENEFENLQHKLDNVLSEKENLEDLLEKNKVSEEDLKRIRAENKNLNSQITLLKVELEEIIERNDRLKDRLQEKESECDSIKNSCKAIEEENKNLSFNCSDLQNHLANLENQTAKKEHFEKQSVSLQTENDELKLTIHSLRQELDEINKRNAQIFLDNRTLTEENSSLQNETMEIKLLLDDFKRNQNISESELKQLKADLKRLEDENNRLKDLCNKDSNKNMREIDQLKQDLKRLEEENSCMKNKSDLEECLTKENAELKWELSQNKTNQNNLEFAQNNLKISLQNLERQCEELIHEKQLLNDEIQELKTRPLNDSHDTDKINDFYRNEIEKLKSKNEKLNRQLDETIVTLNHCAQLNISTEIEYLRNVLYNYMLGKESIVLARVIAAVCKFDEKQTEAVLQREQQKQTLLGHLGII